MTHILERGTLGCQTLSLENWPDLDKTALVWDRSEGAAAIGAPTSIDFLIILKFFGTAASLVSYVGGVDLRQTIPNYRIIGNPYRILVHYERHGPNHFSPRLSRLIECLCCWGLALFLFLLFRVEVVA